MTSFEKNISSIAKRWSRVLLSPSITAFTILANLIMSMINMLAAGTGTSGDDSDSECGDLIGDYNFRTCKFDNGTDPYGWYEEDL